MKKIVVNIIFIVVSIMLTNYCSSLHANDKQGFELTLKPFICIRKIREKSCETSVLIQWKSPVIGNYCLYNELTKKFLNCWENAQSGQHIEKQKIMRSYFYWLSADNSPIKLVKSEFTVLDVRSPERRKNRKRRHIWSVL